MALQVFSLTTKSSVILVLNYKYHSLLRGVVSILLKKCHCHIVLNQKWQSYSCPKPKMAFQLWSKNKMTIKVDLVREAVATEVTKKLTRYSTSTTVMVSSVRLPLVVGLAVALEVQ